MNENWTEIDPYLENHFMVFENFYVCVTMPLSQVKILLEVGFTKVVYQLQ